MPLTKSMAVWVALHLPEDGETPTLREVTVFLFGSEDSPGSFGGERWEWQIGYLAGSRGRWELRRLIVDWLHGTSPCVGEFHVDDPTFLAGPYESARVLKYLVGVRYYGRCGACRAIDVPETQNSPPHRRGRM